MLSHNIHSPNINSCALSRRYVATVCHTFGVPVHQIRVFYHLERLTPEQQQSNVQLYRLRWLHARHATNIPVINFDQRRIGFFSQLKAGYGAFIDYVTYSWLLPTIFGTWNNGRQCMLATEGDKTYSPMCPWRLPPVDCPAPDQHAASCMATWRSPNTATGWTRGMVGGVGATPPHLCRLPGGLLSSFLTRPRAFL